MDTMLPDMTTAVLPATILDMLLTTKTATPTATKATRPANQGISRLRPKATMQIAPTPASAIPRMKSVTRSRTMYRSSDTSGLFGNVAHNPDSRSRPQTRPNSSGETRPIGRSKRANPQPAEKQMPLAKSTLGSDILPNAKPQRGISPRSHHRAHCNRSRRALAVRRTLNRTCRKPLSPMRFGAASFNRTCNADGLK